jgi:hypothetical protein
MTKIRVLLSSETKMPMMYMDGDCVQIKIMQAPVEEIKLDLRTIWQL